MYEEGSIEKGEQENKVKKNCFCRFLSKVWKCILYLISLLVRLCKWIYHGILWLLRGCKGKKEKGSDSDDQIGAQNYIGKEEIPNQNYINKEKIPNLVAQDYPGKEGLPNIGNTCYLNSVLQILASTKELWSSLNLDCELSKTLMTIIKMINREAPPCFQPEIRKLLKFINPIYSNFVPGMQNDSKELYWIIIDKCAENNDKLKEIFFIISGKRFRCENGHIEKKEDVSLFLIVPGNFSEGLDSLIKKLEQTTSFNGANSLYCNTCQDLKDTHTTEELILPKILVFYFSGQNPKDRHLKDSETLKGQKYELYGVICFYPSYNHYVAFTLDNGIWMEYNDAHVGKNNPDHYYAYMAFYRRIE